MTVSVVFLSKEERRQGHKCQLKGRIAGLELNSNHKLSDNNVRRIVSNSLTEHHNTGRYPFSISLDRKRPFLSFLTLSTVPFLSLALSTSLSSPSTGKQPFVDGNRLSLRPIAPYLAGKPRIRIY
ncbi:hypothetical protein NC652_001491 [Populus alba x Populus x berolinensis]|nr:hypothetical protein NC652_001491 [Populus alba x Populus x berolinensis]